ncbi:MAG TPA: hypothetical protein VFF11_13950 [Candidatus Binatia bacterium]|nr:hypothetical protein [Candidatus Binatia bacterium]
MDAENYQAATPRIIEHLFNTRSAPVLGRGNAHETDGGHRQKHLSLNLNRDCPQTIKEFKTPGYRTLLRPGRARSDAEF